MIKESKSTPSIIREIFNEISRGITINLKEGRDFIIQKDINKTLYVNNVQRSLLCNLDIVFKSGENYNGNINFKSCIDSNFKKCVITIYVPEKFNRNNINKSLIHELTHLYELYQIKDIFDHSSWTKSINLYKFDRLELNKFSILMYFRDIYYASLPHEIRATISSLEIYLISFESKDPMFLRSELEKTNEWKRYESMVNFDPDSLSSDMIMEYGLKNTLYILNLFNRINNISYNLESISDVLKYFKGWKKYLNHVSLKIKIKIDKKIKEIVESKEDSLYIHEDKEIMNYEDYLKIGLREKNLEDLIDFNVNSFIL